MEVETGIDWFPKNDNSFAIVLNISRACFLRRWIALCQECIRVTTKFSSPIAFLGFPIHTNCQQGTLHLVLVDRDSLYLTHSEDCDVSHRPPHSATNIENLASRTDLELIFRKKKHGEVKSWSAIIFTIARNSRIIPTWKALQVMSCGRKTLFQSSLSETNEKNTRKA